MAIECSKSLDTEISQLSTLTVPNHITNSNIHSVPSCSVGQGLLNKLCCGGALGLLNCQNLNSLQEHGETRRTGGDPTGSGAE